MHRDLKPENILLTDDEQIEQSLEKAENHYYEMGTALYGDDF